MSVRFYSLKHRRYVDVPSSEVRKRTISREGANAGPNSRHLFVARTEVDGVPARLTRIVSRAEYDASDIIEERSE